MVSDIQLCGGGSSPEILCVSDSRDTAAHIRNAVATHRPTATIETTTDPTVVPELLTVWGVGCVVAAADMQPVSGVELRSRIQDTLPETAVVVVSVEPTAHESDLAVVADDTADTDGMDDAADGADAADAATKQSKKLADRLDETHTPGKPEGQSDPNDPEAGGLARLIEADSRCELLARLDAAVSELPAVSDHRQWLSDGDGSLEPAEEAAPTTVPSVVREAAETASPQQPAEKDTVAGESASTNQPESTRTVAYPLGEQGVLSVTYAPVTPAVDDYLRRLTTVAGVCLDYQATIDDLETRFRQLAERNRMLSQFARTVSHDLNSPLSVIYGRIELALANPTEAEIHLQAARNAAERVDSLITDHLQSIETIDAESEREPVSVQTVAIQAWRIIDPSTARLQVEPQLETVEANAIRLQQLFENLIRNAIEHGSEESVGLGARPSRDPHDVFEDSTESVTVTIKPTDSGFAVSDDGPGIAPSERDEIFESGYTTTESGSGLGLHIVREIVDSHDWEISVTDSEHGGARFEIDTQ